MLRAIPLRTARNLYNYSTMSRVAGTESFILNHTMFRIKDPKASLKFYTEILGMELVKKADGGDFTNYFLAFPSPELASLSAEEKEARATSIPGVLELCHNWGTEDPSQNFEGYTNGNEEGKKGFGHIAVSVDDVQKSCDRFTELGVEFKKRPEEGKMRNIAFIYDPDHYWIEIVPKRL
ncbi:hypothetical protein FFLO_02491 [Filobasidium floriforme]|uniref:Lactoylglutathione lyase n=1 Tax=Filobasidium floriforme TaxID=5210 RepID=A0A8K0NU11_9TREE|nr:Glyoxalase/Bleomycin resistance protein/Dihydroxybiphenyl dioxygenase [Filobasidium floriforme]KAG7562112.1 hypothetical protein FFLO_02491 [Filobasidium floriforme]KAH8081803.1 Glyoxalase/Bleomycin resistance protein/Dihydroxybiphenyl dioxygenase [Filobasidium floriforme]